MAGIDPRKHSRAISTPHGDAVVWNLDGLSEFDIVQLLEPTLLSHQPLDPEYGPEG